MAVFNNNAGNHTFRGTEGTYDQVDYEGQLTDYSFTQNANGSVTVAHPTLGTDTLFSIEGFWLSGEERWYSLQDALTLSSGNGFVDENGVRNGSDGNDTLSGTAADDVFYGGLGHDSYSGGGGYNQVNFDGSLLEYRVSENADGSVNFSHASWGDDVLTDIDGLWFAREARWYSMDDAIAAASGNTGFIIDEDGVLNGTSGNDVMRGTNASDFFYGGTGNDIMDGDNGGFSTAYDQVNYDGAVSDYSFARQRDGSILVEHPVWGTDVLIDIEGIWFNGDSVWRSTDSLVGSSTTRDVARVAPTPDIDLISDLSDNVIFDEVQSMLMRSDSAAETYGVHDQNLDAPDWINNVDFLNHSDVEAY